MENPLKLTLSVPEACQALGLSRPVVDAYIHREKNPLPDIKAGRRYVIPRNALEQWMMEEVARDSGTAKTAWR